MGILDRFRTQPRWKHSDPAVRTAAVYDAGPEDAEALRTLAREDAEARVRRAAVSRMGDVDVLTDVARTDPDADVRAEAVRGLAGLAAETNDPEQARTIMRHLVSLGRLKEVVVAARATPHVAVRGVAVEMLDDPRSLGSIARHAADGATRLLALSRIQGAEELLAVALRSEHTDVSVSALERLNADEDVSAVAQRARNKVAARRARTRLRQADAAVSTPAEPIVSRMGPEDQARAEQILARLEAVVAIADPDGAASALTGLRREWAELQADVEVDADRVARAESASEAAREAMAERRRDREAEEARAADIAREQVERTAIVAEIEQLSGPEGLDRIAELKVAWDGLPQMPAEYAASLTRRFQDACRSFEGRERRRALAEGAAVRLDSLATELVQLAASEQPIEEVVARWRGLRRDADVLREHAAANPEAAERLEAAVVTLEELEQRFQEVRSKQEQENLRRLQQLCRQVDALLAGPMPTLKAAERALRDVRAALDGRAPLPSRNDRQEIQTKLESLRDVLGPKVQERRDADEWQRWANVQVQEELCRAMEALKEEADLELAARRMRELQARWKPVALAPRAQGEVIWRRFKAAQDQVYVRTSAHLAEQAAARAANLTRKQALIERAEALSTSTDWVKTATEIQALQADWKGIGPVSRGHEKVAWERFRAACDHFFTRRQEDLKRRRDEWAANLSRKEALCVAAEALTLSTEWDRAAAELKQLQAAWKVVGPVRKSKSDVIWQRFRAACDAFFERYKHRGDAEQQEKVAAREAIVQRLEGLLPLAGEAVDAPADLAATLQRARADWHQAPEVPRGLQQDLSDRFHHAVGRVVGTWPSVLSGTEFDPETTRKRMEKLLARVEELAAAQPTAETPLSPAELLARQWRERLAANTIRGGKTDEQDDSRWKAAEQEVRSAQAQWARLGPVPPDVAGPLNQRFQRACRRFLDQRRRAS